VITSHVSFDFFFLILKRPNFNLRTGAIQYSRRS